MDRPVVLDASALLADIKNEPGADNVRGIMRESANVFFMHAVNASEVAYHLICFGLPSTIAFRLATPKGVVIVEDLERRLWERSAVLKAEFDTMSSHVPVAAFYSSTISHAGSGGNFSRDPAFKAEVFSRRTSTNHAYYNPIRYSPLCMRS